MFKILKTIQTLLGSDSDVVNLVGDKIFPNVVPDKNNTGQNIDLPVVILNRTLTPQSVKLCNVFNVQLEVLIYSTNYSEAVDIAEAIYNALDKYSGEVDGIMLSKINFSDAGEGFVEGAYLQRLLFTIR